MQLNSCCCGSHDLNTWLAVEYNSLLILYIATIKAKRQLCIVLLLQTNKQALHQGDSKGFFNPPEVFKQRLTNNTKKIMQDISL